MTNQAVPSTAVETYLGLAIGREPHAAVRLALDLLDRGVPSNDVIVDLLGVAQRTAGERWLCDEFTVSDEHLVSGVTQKVLDALANAVEAPATSHGWVVVACPEGDWHSLPAQMFAEQLRSHGYAVTFPGASTPVDRVSRLMARHRPDALAVSCTLPLYFSGLTSLVDAAHVLSVPVLAGGHALGVDTGRATRLGADGWAETIAQAVIVLERWHDLPPHLPDGPTRLEPAALELEASADALAATALGRLSRDWPLFAGYDDLQVAGVRADLALMVRFVAAARLVDDPDVFTELLTWLTALLSSRAAPRLALDAGLRVLSPLIGELDTRAGQIALSGLTPTEPTAQ